MNVSIITPAEVEQRFPHALGSISDDPTWHQNVEGEREFFVHSGVLYHRAFLVGAWDYGVWDATDETWSWTRCPE